MPDSVLYIAKTIIILVGICFRGAYLYLDHLVRGCSGNEEPGGHDADDYDCNGKGDPLTAPHVQFQHQNSLFLHDGHEGRDRGERLRGHHDRISPAN